jgi:hypothetical protein
MSDDEGEKERRIRERRMQREKQQKDFELLDKGTISSDESNRSFT